MASDRRTITMMLTRIRQLRPALLAIAALLATSAHARLERTQTSVPPAAVGDPVIEVFVDTDQRVAISDRIQPRVTLYRVDGVEAVKAALGEGLPSDPALAAAEAKRRFNALAGPALDHLKQSARGLGKAIEYGIDRYPAIVFANGQSVVYGLLDVDAALVFYQQRIAQP